MSYSNKDLREKISEWLNDKDTPSWNFTFIASALILEEAKRNGNEFNWAKFKFVESVMLPVFKTESIVSIGSLVDER